MSFIDDFDLDNYETIDELREARDTIRSEIRTLNGYVSAILDKLIMLEDAGMAK